MQEEELDKVVLQKLDLPAKGDTELKEWKSFLTKLDNPKSKVKIGLVGKYIELKDSYKSIVEAFIHAGSYNECEVEIDWIHSDKITPENVKETIEGLDGILVAPGFGSRGIKGKILAIQYVRENNVPFLGICLGMQCAVIEYARNVLGWKDAHTTEIVEDCTRPVINIMEDQKTVTDKGGTMRLGSYKCKLLDGTKIAKAYNEEVVKERHRHRYEFNNAYLEDFETSGMIATGKNPESGLVEVVELPEHPWFVGAQFHPEYKSTVEKPHPLFLAFVKAAIVNKK